ncbi:MAG TPA: cation:proton antiporter [Bacteroidales bacterium]|nr:cation:proton antiporter [Bacteroidales bacterium]
MTNYIILFLCILVIISYIFAITSKYSKIPSVILLIGLGIGIQLIGKSTKFEIPNIRPILPVIGTLGLIMIIMEASLDLKLERSKKGLIVKSISSAFILFAVFTAAFSYIMVGFFDYSLRDSLLNGIPLGIISSSVAIPSAIHLHVYEKEFIVYESSFSDIFGIILFDFILINQSSIGKGILNFGTSIFFTLIIAILTSSILAFLLHKVKYHVHYVIIMTSVVLVYMLAKLVHLPALLLVLVFGLVMSNNQILQHTVANKVFDFDEFRDDLGSFKKILTELTFLVRSFFFIMFGYYTKIEGLFDWHSIIAAVFITAGIFLLRMIYLKYIIKLPLVPLLFFFPRGLITILLFISVPLVSRISVISEEVITIVILLTIIILMIGNIFYKKEHIDDPNIGVSRNEPVFPVNI